MHPTLSSRVRKVFGMQCGLQKMAHSLQNSSSPKNQNTKKYICCVLASSKLSNGKLFKYHKLQQICSFEMLDLLKFSFNCFSFLKCFQNDWFIIPQKTEFFLSQSSFKFSFTLNAFNFICLPQIYKGDPTTCAIFISNWGYSVFFPTIKITMICQVPMYWGLSVKINMYAALRAKTMDTFCLRVFLHVVIKSLNDNANTQGYVRSGISLVYLWCLPICDCL